MSLVCAQCSRVNPADAAYCYHDGAALAGRSGGPINPGSVQFPTPFVFPNGQACRNFDQLAINCQQNWTAALDLLKQGFLASFFGGLGRVDLAVAAQDAARFPDPDRGLDQLLAKIPSQVVEAPKLQAEPSEINLGQLPMGSDRTVELHLRNQGMRLLYGSVASDSKWLTLGDAPGLPQKIFQFGEETVVLVQIHGQHLRAGIRPLEGQLVVDSNGGTVTITVRADVPVTPFRGGLFDGAVTPRQVAEKSKGNPKDAAPYFQDGRVAEWFQSNGWTYPVQGPPMSGMGAVQQFFEALGVAKPPQVQASPASFEFEGGPGKVFERTIEVTSAERKVVYGWATSDQPWVAIGKTRLSGKAATIPLTVTIPDRAGTQVAQLTVVGNGQQRFSVPVTVAVIGGAEIMDAEIIEPEETVPMEMVEESMTAEMSVPTPVMAAPAAPGRPPSVPVMSLEPPVMAAPPPPPVMRSPAPVIAPPPLLSTNPGDATVTFAEGPGTALAASAPLPETELDLTAPGAVVSRPAALLTPAKSGRRYSWIHLVPAGLLVVALMGTCMRDAVRALFFPSVGTRHEIDSQPLLVLNFDYNFDPKRVDKSLGNSMMVGLERRDPERGKGAELKKLTWGRHGNTNSLIVKIGGRDRVFGNVQTGRYYQKPENAGNPPTGKKCAFEFLPERIVVTQEVRIVPGEPVEVGTDEKGAVYKRLMDTCLFYYKVENKDNQPHEVGLRYLLDTYIGSNDDVPFTLPGVPGMVDTFKELKGEAVPDFVQVLENPDLKNPGLIAQLNLRLGEKYEAPTRIKLTAHPMVQMQKQEGLTKDTWEIPLSSIKEAKDSSVVLYWDPQQIPAGKYRETAFTYGLGNVSIGPAAKLGLTVGGAMLVGSELTVVALLSEPQPGQTVELTLPPGLVLPGGAQAMSEVPPSTERNKDGKLRPSPVSWRVRADREGDFNIVVETRIGGEVVRQERRVAIKQPKVF